MLSISTHTPLAGRDRTQKAILTRQQGFLLTRPSRGATGALFMEQGTGRDFYSHAPRGARRDSLGGVFSLKHFYSHAPRGARQITSQVTFPFFVFLLTRPSRGATISSTGKHGLFWYFYSHAPRGARPNDRYSENGYSPISTHTPLAGRDTVEDV